MKTTNKNNPEQSGILNNPYFILILFASLPVFNFIAQNTGETGFSPVRSLLYSLTIFVVSVILLSILRLLFPRVRPLFFAVFIGLSMVITFNGYLIEGYVFSETFGSQHRIRYIILIYSISLVLCGFVSWFLARNKKILSIVMVGACAFALTDLANIGQWAFAMYKAGNLTGAMSGKNHEQIISDEREAALNPEKPASPDVYFILPDMMFGEEMFTKYGIEPDTLDGIRARGFQIIKRARSNAPVTEYSLPHIFGMNYYLKDGEQVTKTEMQKIKNIYIKENLVYKEFRKRGYKIYAVNDGYWSGCGRGEDACIRKKKQSILKEQDLRFLERTAFMKSLDLIDTTFNIFPTPMNLWPYTNRMEVPELTHLLPKPSGTPFFLYIHLGGLPHYPLRFRRDCSYHRYDDIKVSYPEQYRCAVKYLELLVDSILARDKTAMIVIQSDHGVSISNQHLKQVEDLTEEDMRENLSIISAYHIPEECRNYLHPGFSPVNTFRLIFACLDGKQPELLPDRHFLVYYLRWPSGGKVREWRYQ